VKHSVILMFLAVTACQNNHASDAPTGVPETDPAQRAAELLPMAVGNRWTYVINTSGDDHNCPHGTRPRVIEAADALDGRVGVLQTSYCSDEKVHLARVGDEIQQYGADQWRTTFASPLAEGKTWEPSPGIKLHWHRIGWVKVLAGTFPDCWERLGVDPKAPSQVYCMGVGMVSEIGSNYVAELQEFSLF
jgi:hypothetical protein